VDMSEEFPKPLTDEVVRAADVVITMGCGDACPIYPGKKYEGWELDDPAGMTSRRCVGSVTSSTSACRS
jgi:arsenate reductase